MKIWTATFKYLDHVKMRYSAKTYDEKRRALRNPGKHLGNVPLGEITPGVALEFMDTILKERSAAVANRARKNLSASWEWGRKFMDNFPCDPKPFHGRGQIS
ncbi:hypothetical protein DPQ33_17420 [Oceanidesulfovibrio indonesiensis]|uniref:Core-binding (CB) domain-containing protein n=1 Tax=Oceanidesulfovibrio indonesiensis TaxID=54767 RepID=A0A7M3MAU0_9BACT|nr:hypothetical protein DPQ33_17420 [Oceanidesulfovibrio indonesiensis]